MLFCSVETGDLIYFTQNVSASAVAYASSSCCCAWVTRLKELRVLLIAYVFLAWSNSFLAFFTRSVALKGEILDFSFLGKVLYRSSIVSELVESESNLFLASTVNWCFIELVDDTFVQSICFIGFGVGFFYLKLKVVLMDTTLWSEPAEENEEYA